MAFTSFKKADTRIDQDGLHINKRKNRVNARLSAFNFIDKDTGQYVIMVPSLDITGYGSTAKKAEEMLRFSLGEFLDFLLNGESDDVNRELSLLGWKRNAFRNKEFSNAFVDKNGDLKGFNAANEITRTTLVA